ncbi:SDR family oxidoreductase [Streptomyces sp. NPDC056479]|uniref:SDR family oxidoreductase n=1 Tax=Streptomyces sp. NPDC056479 TaxID=3345832 RepID=UPI0036C3F72A
METRTALVTAAALGLGQEFAVTLAPYGITVNAIAPSMVRTATAQRTVGADGGSSRTSARSRP